MILQRFRDFNLTANSSFTYFIWIIILLFSFSVLTEITRSVTNQMYSFILMERCCGYHLQFIRLVIKIFLIHKTKMKMFSILLLLYLGELGSDSKSDWHLKVCKQSSLLIWSVN